MGDITLTEVSTGYSKNDDWFFLKGVTNIEFYPHSMATAKIKALAIYYRTRIILFVILPIKPKKNIRTLPPYRYRSD